MWTDGMSPAASSSLSSLRATDGQKLKGYLDVDEAVGRSKQRVAAVRRWPQPAGTRPWSLALGRAVVVDARRRAARVARVDREGF